MKVNHLHTTMKATLFFSDSNIECLGVLPFQYPPNHCLVIWWLLHNEKQLEGMSADFADLNSLGFVRIKKH